jgi:FKBP-type peptidyl-prolyl cis-trans isomerase FkpA
VFRYDAALYVCPEGEQMRQSVLILVFLIAAVLAAQTKKPASPASTPTPAAAPKPTPTPTPAVTPTKVSGKPKVTPSGVQYWDIKVGKGAVASKGKTVTVLYTGWLENGKEFDSREDMDEALQVTLGDGKLIKGWDEGMIGMKVGGKRKMRIPAEAAYGKEGAPPTIPPNSTLVMDVQLIAVK